MKQTMKSLITIIAIFCTAALWGETVSPDKITLTGKNSNFLIKLTSSLNAATSKPGDPVTGVVILPLAARGGRVVGRVDRADHCILKFSFQTMTYKDKAWQLHSELTSVVSSKGNAGQDDLGQRVRLDGGGVIAYGVTTAIDEGAEIRFVGWE
jgi:hypothetical protein